MAETQQRKLIEDELDEAVLCIACDWRGRMRDLARAEYQMRCCPVCDEFVVHADTYNMILRGIAAQQQTPP